jgi:flagellar biosynthesis protein FlhF
MNIKRYLAPDMRRAINLVRTEHGPDAVILSSESVDGGVEIIAAVDYDQSLVARAFGRPGKAADNSSAEPRLDDEVVTLSAQVIEDAPPSKAAKPEQAEKPPKSRKFGRFARSVASAVSAEPAAIATTTATTAIAASAATAEPDARTATDKSFAPTATANTATAKLAAPATASEAAAAATATGATAAATAAATVAATVADADTTRELRAIQKDLFALKGLVRERFAWSDLRAMTPQRNWLMRRAESFGLTAELADTVVSEVEHPGQDDRAWREVVFGLAKRLSVMREDPLDQGGVFALVGPTGVGKTTTIAKLAARHCLRHGRESVALITTDTVRIGAHRQLEAFAAILGVPVRTADSPDKLARLLGELGNRKLVLIDTAGSAPRDTAITSALQQLDVCAGIRRFLVLAANMQASVMRDAVRAFGGSDLAGVVLTKLDETNALGAAVSVLIGAKLPAVWLSDGQRVPEDLKLARVAHLLKPATAVDEAAAERIVPAFAGGIGNAVDGGRVHVGI